MTYAEKIVAVLVGFGFGLAVGVVGDSIALGAVGCLVGFSTSMLSSLIIDTE
mgnify:CR=1 FL=1